MILREEPIVLSELWTGPQQFRFQRRLFPSSTWACGHRGSLAACRVLVLRSQEEGHKCLSSDGYTVAHGPGQHCELPVANCRSVTSLLLPGFREETQWDAIL